MTATTSLQAMKAAGQSAAHREEFERLFQGSYSRAYGAALRMLGNPTEAEDLTQEAFVRIWTSFDRYDRARPFEGWLFRILSNLAIDRWRRAGNYNVCSLDADSTSRRGPNSGSTLRSGAHEAGRSPLMACIADDRPSAMPEQSCLRAEDGRRVRKALSAIPRDYRDAVLLADVKGFSYEEIADRVGCPVGTIRSRLHRGRHLLRQQIIKLECQETGQEPVSPEELRESVRKYIPAVHLPAHSAQTRISCARP